MQEVAELDLHLVCLASGLGPLLHGPSQVDRGGRRDWVGLAHSSQAD